jgi:predicted patatin/cPLA2 family phospholipase
MVIIGFAILSPRPSGVRSMAKIALCLQGGGSRGAYVAGPLQVLMENGIWADFVAGTSCGSLMGCNYLSKQTHRAEEETIFMCDDKEFFKPYRIFSKEKTMFNYDHLLNQVTHRELPFDYDTFFKNPCKFYAVSTSCLDGKAAYLEKSDPDFFPDAIAASSALPLTTKPVVYHGVPYLDGGVACPIAFEKALLEGYDKIIVVATRAKGYRKGELKPLEWRLSSRMYRDYPAFLECYARSSTIYNAQMDLLAELEEAGRIFVIYPSIAPKVKHSETDKKILQNLIDLGKKDALEALPQIKSYLSK